MLYPLRKVDEGDKVVSEQKIASSRARVKSPQAKSTQAEITLRIEQVTQWVIDGERRSKIVQNGSKKWHVTTRQIDEYLKAAKDRLAEASKTNLEQARGVALARCDDIYRAHHKRCPHAALKAVELSADLQGLVQKQQINVTANASTTGTGLTVESMAEVQRVVHEAAQSALDEQAKRGGTDATQS